MTDYRQPIVFMLAASLCFTVMNMTALSVNHLPAFEIVFFRSIGTVVCAMFVITKQRIPIFGNNPKILIVRALTGMTSMVLYYKAIQMMPIGTAAALRYLSPFFATGLAVIFLGERVKKLQWLLLAAAFAGVILLKGFDHRLSVLGLAIILTSAFFSGLVYVIIRKIGDSEHPVVIVNYFLSICTIVSGVICLFHWQQPVGIEWLGLLSMGLFGYVAQILMTKAMQAAETNLIVPFKYAEVVFTILFAWIIFGEIQSQVSLFGILIIVLALIGNVMVKERKGQKP